MGESIEVMDQAVKAITIQTGKYLTFLLEDEEYGIGILKVSTGMLTGIHHTKE